jgi:hypothetical protein
MDEIIRQMEIKISSLLCTKLIKEHDLNLGQAAYQSQAVLHSVFLSENWPFQ